MRHTHEHWAELTPDTHLPMGFAHIKTTKPCAVFLTDVETGATVLLGYGHDFKVRTNRRSTYSASTDDSKAKLWAYLPPSAEVEQDEEVFTSLERVPVVDGHAGRIILANRQEAIRKRQERFAAEEQARIAGLIRGDDLKKESESAKKLKEGLKDGEKPKAVIGGDSEPETEVSKEKEPEDV